MKSGVLFLAVLVSVITGLVCGSEAVRWVMAGLLLVGAVPLWQAMRQLFQGQFWKDVEDVIVASDAQQLKEPPSVQE